MLRLLIDALIGLVVEETARHLIPRLLRHAWMLILCIATWELGEYGKDFALEAFKMAKDRNLVVPSYIAVAVLGAVVFMVYWWGVGRAMTALAASKHVVSDSEQHRLKLLEDSQQMLEALDAYVNEWVKAVQALPAQIAARNKRVGADENSASQYAAWQERKVRQELRDTYQQTYADKAKTLRGQLMREVPSVSDPSTSYDNPENGGELNGIYFDFKGLVEAYRNKLTSEGVLKPRN